MQRRQWRPLRYGPMFTFKPEEAPMMKPTCILDGIYMIGDEFVTTIVVETEDGYLLFDCLFPGEKSWNIIKDGFEELGLDITRIRHLIITHGHHDHYGCSKLLVDATGAKTYMNMIDYEIAINGKKGHLEVNIDQDIREGDVLDIGGLEIRCFNTPGHTDGSMSFLFDVYDEGTKHTAAIFGGAGCGHIPMESIRQYIASATRFGAIAYEAGADVVLSTHQWLDGGKAKIQAVNDCPSLATPNPFVIGKENVKRFHDGLVYLAYQSMEREIGKISKERVYDPDKKYLTVNNSVDNP